MNWQCVFFIDIWRENVSRNTPSYSVHHVCFTLDTKPKKSYKIRQIWNLLTVTSDSYMFFYHNHRLLLSSGVNHMWYNINQLISCKSITQDKYIQYRIFQTFTHAMPLGTHVVKHLPTTQIKRKTVKHEKLQLSTKYSSIHTVI